jgi:PAS domain S-box-containing protein
MRLSYFIQVHKESILQEWEDFARTIEPPALTMDVAALRDHASLILDDVCAQLDLSETADEQFQKSRGRAPRRQTKKDAENHAIDRLDSGYSIDQLVSEYRALRASVLKLWAADSDATQSTDAQDIMRFNEAIDQVLAESVAQFSLTLRDSEAKFRTITDAMPQMVWSTLPDGHHDYYNRQWYEFTGVREGSTDGDGWRAMFHPDDRDLAWERWQHSLRSGDDYEIQYRLKHHSGSYRWTLGRALPIRSKSGEIVRWMGTCTDIHDQKMAEESLKEVDRRKDEFLAMLAHELRNPLAPLGTAAEILMLGNIDRDMVAKTSSVISRQVRHMTGLVDDLLDVSRVTRGLAVLTVETVDMRSIVNVAVEQARPLIDARGHELTVRMGSAAAHVNGDRLRLVQVVANLLNNAAKFTAFGGRIEVSVQALGSDVVLSVVDTGAGIDANLLPHVFELFTQGERSPDRSQGGLGVGLSLVKSLVELHGGRVQVTSTPGQGSNFTIVMPLQPATGATNESRAASGETSRVRPLTILLVDDNADAAAMLAMRLRAVGHEVTVKHDARSALSHDSTAAPEIFILDIGLPDLDGYELARELRQRPAAATATFIALTGYGHERDRVKSKAAGFHHHLVKPIEGEKLIRFLAESV